MSPSIGTLFWLVTHNPIKILKAALSSAFYLILCVVLPFLLLSMAQGDPQLRSMLDTARSTVGIDVAGIVNTIMIFGIVLALLVLVVGLTDKWSATNLACGVACILLQLAILLTILGAGDIGSFGVISKTVQAPGPSQPSFVIDMRLVALAVTAIAGAKIIVALAGYLDARRERARRFSPTDLLKRAFG